MIVLDDLDLFNALKGAQNTDLSAAEVRELTALVERVARSVEPRLSAIHHTFQQYTLHDLRHSRNIILLMWRILPAPARKKLNPLELAFALLAALLHDIGMHMEDQERADVIKSSDFMEFRSHHCDRVDEARAARDAGDHNKADAIEAALLAEYVRRGHAARSAAFVRDQLGQKLVFREESFADRLADLCESHVWPALSEQAAPNDRSVEQLPTPSEYPVSNVPVNVRYLACVLRLADIMDFDRSRTPLSVFHSLRFTEGRSWEEWSKHLQVGGWDITETRVRYRAECDHPAFLVGVHQFLDAVDRELRDTQYVVDRFDRAVDEAYCLDLPQVVDRRGVKMKDPRFVAGGFRFALDYERIMDLLMDKSLYPEESLFLRELLQNSLDACRRLVAFHAASNSVAPYHPRITVWDYSSDTQHPRIVFQDNGVGMSQGIVEEYFMQVGRSYYRSQRFEGERRQHANQGIPLEASSHFGIGVLSCFLVADEFEVETYQHGSDPLRIRVEGRTKYFVVEKLPRPDTPQFPAENLDHLSADHALKQPGTRIHIPLKPGVHLDVEKILSRLVVNAEVNVEVRRKGEPAQSVRRFGWERTAVERICPNLRLNPRVNSGLSEAAIEENLGSVLFRSPIEFGRWTFSEHIRGAAWFWFLRGDNGPELVRGELSIEQELTPVGLAQWVQDVRVTWRDKPEDREKALALVERGSTPDELLAGRRRWGHLSNIPSRLPNWSRYSDDLKYRALQFALTLPSDSALPWYAISGLPLQLLEGEGKWLDHDVSIGALNSHPPHRVSLKGHALALHGILVPGGVAFWEPSRANMGAASLMPVQGTAWLDYRGKDAPIPVANRLFVHAQTQGPVALLPFYRAVWRHAIEILQPRSKDTYWRKWSTTVLRSAVNYALAGDYEALKEEMALADEVMLYQVVENGALRYEPRARVIATFGPEVPLVKRHRDEWDGDGLVWDDEMTRWLSQLHRTDGSPTPEVVRLDNLRRDLHHFGQS